MQERSMQDFDRATRDSKQVYQQFDDDEYTEPNHTINSPSTAPDSKKAAAYLGKCVRCDGKLEDLDKDMVDNEYILTGYRLNYRGFCNTLKTMFKCHNETFNVWSHFLPGLIFFTFALYIAICYPNFSTAAKTGLVQ